MNNTELARNLALASIAAGKTINAVGKTPEIPLTSELRNQLALTSSLIQFGGGALLTDVIRTNPEFQFIVRLNFLNYSIFSIQLIQDVHDDPLLIRQALSANLREIAGDLMLLTIHSIWSKLYSLIGITLIALGHMMQALGRRQQLDQEATFTEVNKQITLGSWIDACGSTIILLGNLADTV
ncbi:DUF6944 family repetitive protein [Sporolactobacillus vineae]|uniref:DUF6944 family repetitive protein n=1 Tax=Sporolactobacillus vineae TaxID=444463 RepID=UPI0002882901|nr:hypothetical protein [Sporolactobacillus vineae]